jgi:adenylate cyclase
VLDERIPTELNYVVGIDFLFVVFIGVLMAWASFKLRPAKLMLLTVTLTISLLSFNYWILAAHHLLLPISAPLICIFGIYLFQASYGYFIESRAKKQVTEMFSSYVPPDLVEVIARNPEVFNMKATEKNLTVLFVNIREFSSIAEKLSPHDLAEWINMYLSLVSEIISVQNKGTLDKYMGDSVMAFWGAPLPDDNHAEHAVNAAIQIKQSAEQLNFKFRQRGWPTMALSIGINTGLMHVGDMGSNIRRAYTVMGDAVNIAAQIQTLTRQYGIDILMASQTAAELNIFEFRAIDCVKFTGRRHVIELFEPIAKRTELTPEAISELSSWKESLQFYRSEDWESALHKINELNSTNPTNFLYALYKRRVEAFILNPKIIEVDKSFKVPPRYVQNFLKPDFSAKTEI